MHYFVFEKSGEGVFLTLSGVIGKLPQITITLAVAAKGEQRS